MSNRNNNPEYDKLKEELLVIINNEQSRIMEKLDNKINESNMTISESNKVMEENKRIIECFLEQRYQIDKIENLERMAKKTNDSLISHEIRINNSCNEISLIKTKYDKIVLDNLLVSGYIGPSCQFKNLSSYLKNNISEFGKLKIENENIKKETKEFKRKLDGASKNITNLIDGGVLRCNQYADNRINDFHVFLENKIKEMNDKNMEIRMKNIQFQTKIEEQINDLKLNYEEKMIKQKDDLSQIINNKIEYLNMNYSSFEKNPKIIEIDEIKNKLTGLEKEIKELKQNIQSFKNIENNNNIKGEDKLKKMRRKSLFNEIDGLSNFYHSINNNYKKNIDNNSRFDILRSARKPNFGENNKNASNDFLINMKKEKERNRQLLSPVKSRFHKNSIENSNSHKKTLLNNSRDNDDENSINKNENDINKNESFPKKYNNLKEKINLIENISDNYKEKETNLYNLNNQFNRINNNNKSNNDHDIKKNIDKEELIKKNIYKEELNKNKNNNNNNNNLRNHIINEDSHSFLSISNSSKQDIINEITNNIELEPKALYINKKNKKTNNILVSNITKNKTEKSPINFPDKYKKLHIKTTDNESKIDSNMNFNKSQSNYKNEIVKELFTKYNKGNISTNLNLIKNKPNLDLYNYSISPPDNRFLLSVKINEIIEPPFKEIFTDKSNIFDKNSKEYYTKRNLSLRPSLNMQLFYGNYNETRKNKNKKIKSLSSSEQKININNKIQKNIESKKLNPSFGKTIYSEYIKKENLFTMTCYKNKTFK